MILRFFIYFLVFGAVLYFLSLWGRQNEETGEKRSSGPKSKSWFKSKTDPREVWTQVYETASLEEARALQARLQEDEVECVLYEQGKKDIHGNPMKGFGVAVPKTAAAHSQNVISRTLS